MLAGIHKFIEGNHMIRNGGNVLLAVSGGIDSMVMAHLFLHLPFNKGIAHCNFSLRGKDSDDDEELVKNFCREHNIPFHSVRFNTSEHAHNHGISIQMAARELRYHWFEEVRSQKDYDCIAIAHNLNDNVETLLINLARGTGLAGLSGIKPVSGNIIRPMLFASRDKIVGYQKLNSIAYREDISNSETKYSRNKIRHLVIPVLREINPSIERTLLETAERLSEINSILGEVVTDIRNKVLSTRGDTAIIDINALRNYTGNRTLLFELFRPYGFSNKSMDDILNVISGHTGGQLFSGSHRIVKDRDHLIITADLKSSQFSEITIGKYEDFENSGFFRSVQLAERSAISKIPSEKSTACLDASKIVFPVLIRKWKEGDFFHPLGLNGRKKLSDYFTDKKYSLPEKEKKFVLESDGEIMWVVGERIDDRYKITPETKKVLILQSHR